MLKSETTANLVRETLENDLYLREVLAEGLVNHSALARRLLPWVKKHNPKAKLESIIMAIRRYAAGGQQLISPIVKEIISHAQLSTKNDLVHITFKRSDAVVKELLTASQQIDWGADEIFLINQGSGEITVVIDKQNEDLLKSCKKHVIEKRSDLALISIKEALTKQRQASIAVPGVYTHFINHLARNSINIIEIISTYSQLTLVFNNNDLLQAYRLLDELIRHFR